MSLTTSQPLYTAFLQLLTNIIALLLPLYVVYTLWPHRREHNEDPPINLRHRTTRTILTHGGNDTQCNDCNEISFGAAEQARTLAMRRKKRPVKIDAELSNRRCEGGRLQIGPSGSGNRVHEGQYGTGQAQDWIPYEQDCVRTNSILYVGDDEGRATNRGFMFLRRLIDPSSPRRKRMARRESLIALGYDGRFPPGYGSDSGSDEVVTHRLLRPPQPVLAPALEPRTRYQPMSQGPLFYDRKEIFRPQPRAAVPNPFSYVPRTLPRANARNPLVTGNETFAHPIPQYFRNYSPTLQVGAGPSTYAPFNNEPSGNRATVPAQNVRAPSTIIRPFRLNPRAPEFIPGRRWEQTSLNPQAPAFTPGQPWQQTDQSPGSSDNCYGSIPCMGSCGVPFNLQNVRPYPELPLNAGEQYLVNYDSAVLDDWGNNLFLDSLEDPFPFEEEFDDLVLFDQVPTDRYGINCDIYGVQGSHGPALPQHSMPMRRFNRRNQRAYGPYDHHIFMAGLPNKPPGPDRKPLFGGSNDNTEESGSFKRQSSSQESERSNKELTPPLVPEWVTDPTHPVHRLAAGTSGLATAPLPIPYVLNTKDWSNSPRRGNREWNDQRRHNESVNAIRRASQASLGSGGRGENKKRSTSYGTIWNQELHEQSLQRKQRTQDWSNDGMYFDNVLGRWVFGPTSFVGATPSAQPAASSKPPATQPAQSSSRGRGSTDGVRNRRGVARLRPKAARSSQQTRPFPSAGESAAVGSSGVDQQPEPQREVRPGVYASTIGERVKARRAGDVKRRAEERAKRQAECSLDDEPGVKRQESGPSGSKAVGHVMEKMTGMPPLAMEDLMDKTGEVSFEDPEIREDEDE